MGVQEIAAVVINSDYVTNDTSEIDVALLSRGQVEYVSRDYARSMALSGKRGGWEMLAEAPALFVIVDGVRYRRCHARSSISFPISAPNTVPLPIVVG